MSIRRADGSLRRKGPQACSIAMCLIEVLNTSAVRQRDGQYTRSSSGQCIGFQVEAPAQHPDAQVDLS